MTRWFRFYDDAINDPKILKLSDKLYRAWVGLLCIASKNNGILPPFDDLALMLRINPDKLQPLLEALITHGLFDHNDEGIRPHNWDGRQYKSDVSTDRVKRFRNGKRNVSETPPESDTETEPDIVAVAVERASGNLVTPEALQLTEKLLVVAGHDPGFWPPGWCGAPMRVQTWINEGWPPEIIFAAVKGAAARKRGPPANSVNFFENAIAEEVARQAAPVPTVEIKQATNLTVYNGTAQVKSGGSLIDSIKRELADLEREEGAHPSLPGGPILRVSN